MLIESTEIKDVKLITPTRYSDSRGHFSEVYNMARLEQAGIHFRPVQENQSLSRTVGTVRGLHFQKTPYLQSKLVRVLRGRIFDVAIDLRRNAPTYGRWISEELSAADGRQLFIPGGFAHGFCTLEPDTEIAYLVDAPYAPHAEITIRWNDAQIGVTWPEIAGAVVSDRDATAPDLAEIDHHFMN